MQLKCLSDSRWILSRRMHRSLLVSVSSLRLCFLLIWFDRRYTRECLYLKAGKPLLPINRKDLWTYIRRQHGKRDSSRCTRVCHQVTQLTRTRPRFNTGMASPLLGMQAPTPSYSPRTASLHKRIISPYPLSMKAMAGAANAILASPGSPPENLVTPRC